MIPPWMQGVLDGVSVVELTQMVAAPTCGTILMQLGADVVKVESPRGDMARTMGPMVADDESAMWRATNHGKTVVRADIREDEGRQRLITHLSDADVFITNVDRTFRHRCRLTPEQLRREDIAPVYVELSAFGPGGPPGSDSLVQAATGLMGVTGPEGRGGYRAAAPVIDVTAGVWCALGVLAALPAFRAGAPGAHLTVSLEEVALHLQFPFLAVAFAQGGELPPMGNGSPLAATIVVETSTDPVSISILADKHWRALCTETDRTDLVTDVRFATHDGRTAHQTEISREVAEAFGATDQSTWVERLRAAGVPCAPVRQYADVLIDPSTWTRGVLERIDSGVPSLHTGLPIQDGSSRPMNDPQQEKSHG